MADEYPAFVAGGTRFIVLPERVAREHGILDDPAAQRRLALGVRLRRARQRAGLSQAALAAELAVEQPYISATENGREPCSEERAAKWLAACRSTPSRGKR